MDELQTASRLATAVRTEFAGIAPTEILDRLVAENRLTIEYADNCPDVLDGFMTRIRERTIVILNAKRSLQEQRFTLAYMTYFAMTGYHTGRTVTEDLAAWDAPDKQAAEQFAAGLLGYRSARMIEDELGVSA